ncbi:penicillin acylase family protein [Deinococcus multiflagellatus]|uniref:Penicillin acylase family protein n=1 Tax=Deinococcus multiflagellatus TaxID=1656887 RepID=A0ABW1ZLN0_9DEIO
MNSTQGTRRPSWGKRAALGLLVTLGLLGAAGAGGYAWLRATSEPRTAGTLQAPGLGGPVQITRDAWGVPHIRAQRDEDAVFALGFVHWQDRAWQMDFQRRVAQGRLAEVLGEAALPQDKFLRTWGFQRATLSALPALEDRSRRLIRAYTAGVNAAQAQGKVAPEFRILGYTPEPWQEVDSLSWSKLMAFDLGGNYEEEVLGARVVQKLGESGLAQVMAPYPAGAPTILSEDELPARNGRTAAAPTAPSSPRPRWPSCAPTSPLRGPWACRPCRARAATTGWSRGAARSAANRCWPTIPTSPSLRPCCGIWPTFRAGR